MEQHNKQYGYPIEKKDFKCYNSFIASGGTGFRTEPLRPMRWMEEAKVNGAWEKCKSADYIGCKLVEDENAKDDDII